LIFVHIFDPLPYALKYYEEKALKIGNNFVLESALFFIESIRFSCSFRIFFQVYYYSRKL